MSRPHDNPTRPRGHGASRGSWQQPVMSLGALLILAAVLLPLAGVLVRVRLGEQADVARTEFRKAVVAATDSHGPMLAVFTGFEVEYASEHLTSEAERDPRRMMRQYADLQAQYAEWIAAQGRSDLQPTLDAAKQAYKRAQQAQQHAQQIRRQHQTALGRYLRYAGFVGSAGLVLLLWGVFAGIGRRGRL